MIFAAMKIIGIVILAMLALILLAVLAVLFIPFRYKGKIYYKEKPDIDIRMFWLFRFLNISLTYKDESDIKAKIVWFFKFYSNKKTDDDLQEENIENSEKEGVYDYEKSTGIDRDIPKVEKIDRDKAEKTDSKQISELESREKRYSRHLQKSKKFKENENKSEKILNKVKGLWNIIQNDGNKRLVIFLLEMVKKLLKHALPKKIHGFLKFGFEDPSDTGRMLEILAVFYPIYKDNFKIVPMFYDEIIYMDISFKGKLLLFYILYILLKVWFNEDFDRAYKLFKNRKGKNGKK